MRLCCYVTLSTKWFINDALHGAQRQRSILKGYKQIPESDDLNTESNKQFCVDKRPADLLECTVYKNIFLQ